MLAVGLVAFQSMAKDEARSPGAILTSRRQATVDLKMDVVFQASAAPSNVWG